MTYSKLILSVALFLLAVGNIAFFSHLLEAYPLSLENLPYLLSLVVLFGSFYASFAREHKSLRYYANPSYYLYSIGESVGKLFKGAPQVLKLVGEDAKIPETDEDRELVILVVGETARADHFSLNGYERETNPLLLKEKDLLRSDEVTDSQERGR